MVSIRAARADDEAIIRRLIREERLDPTSRDWRHFNVAELNGEVIGIAQIKPYSDCREFGSLVVRRQHRSRGIAGQLIEATLAGERGDVYLLCRDSREAYYSRFGFRRIEPSEAPRTLRYKLGFSRLFDVFGVRIICMLRRA
jgi:N-acetylglutamate synthase-like GNAT family acetyltransferase